MSPLYRRLHPPPNPEKRLKRDQRFDKLFWCLKLLLSKNKMSRNLCCCLFFVGPPDAPSITDITITGKRCLLQWTKPYNGESAIEVYTVSVWILLATNRSVYKERLRSWNTTETKFTLNLGWNRNYTTAVSAWNKYGQSFYGVERHFKTGRFPQGNYIQLLQAYSGTVSCRNFGRLKATLGGTNMYNKQTVIHELGSSSNSLGTSFR